VKPGARDASSVPLQGSLCRTGTRTNDQEECELPTRIVKEIKLRTPNPLIKRSQRGRRGWRSWAREGANGALWMPADDTALLSLLLSRCDGSRARARSNASTMFRPPRIHPAAAACQARQNIGDLGRRDPWEMSSLAGRTS
jgi:hypothetical protein